MPDRQNSRTSRASFGASLRRGFAGQGGALLSRETAGLRLRLSQELSTNLRAALAALREGFVGKLPPLSSVGLFP